MKDATQPTCPHCGEKLPEMVDAFCPECRGPLEEVPLPPPVERRIHRDPLRDSSALFTFLAAFCLIGAAVYVISAVLSPYLGWREDRVLHAVFAGLFLGLLGMVLLFAGARWRGRRAG